MTTDVIKGPDFNRDELFLEGDSTIEKVIYIFNVFASEKLKEINSTSSKVVGIRLAWTTRTHQDGFPISRLDIALTHSHGRPSIQQIDESLTEALANLNEQYDAKP